MCAAALGALVHQTVEAHHARPFRDRRRGQGRGTEQRVVADHQMIDEAVRLSFWASRPMKPMLVVIRTRAPLSLSL